jgi:hypothetical protein
MTKQATPYFLSNRIFVVNPDLFFVIPDLIRDPFRAADVCKGHRCTLDPGSSPGMTRRIVRQGCEKQGLYCLVNLIEQVQ